MKLDLEQATPEQLGEALTRALQLGVEEVRRATPRTGKEIARMICRRWMTGDEHALKAAYMLGRFHAELGEE